MIQQLTIGLFEFCAIATFIAAIFVWAGILA